MPWRCSVVRLSCGAARPDPKSPHVLHTRTTAARATVARLVADWAGSKADAQRSCLLAVARNMVDLKGGGNAVAFIVRYDANEHLGLSVHTTGNWTDR